MTSPRGGYEARSYTLPHRKANLDPKWTADPVLTRSEWVLCKAGPEKTGYYGLDRFEDLWAARTCSYPDFYGGEVECDAVREPAGLDPCCYRMNLARCRQMEPLWEQHNGVECRALRFGRKGVKAWYCARRKEEKRKRPVSCPLLMQARADAIGRRLFGPLLGCV